jgi:7,8-dihydropterin-6-yl-methyl-4-(beta-D-ribofuranosyl)aminobenzene 5'-phosphate synthase
MHSEEHTLCNGFFDVSGYIPCMTEFEMGILGHIALRNGMCVLDTDMKVGRYFAFNVKDKGLVMFSASSLAGIINVCSDAKQKAKGWTTHWSRWLISFGGRPSPV